MFKIPPFVSTPTPPPSFADEWALNLVFAPQNFHNFSKNFPDEQQQQVFGKVIEHQWRATRRSRNPSPSAAAQLPVPDPAPSPIVSVRQWGGRVIWTSDLFPIWRAK